MSLALIAAGHAAPNQPAAPATITAPPVVCDKDKCTCVGQFQECMAALTSEKKCSEEKRCQVPPYGTAEALANKFFCSCKTKSAKSRG
jgi:hypothetical protein